jgi:hypothetical protein
MGSIRKPNTFEIIILIVGVLLIIVGYIFIYRLIAAEGGVGWSAIIAVFLWMILLTSLILVAVNENIKEELKELIVLNIEENRLLRQELERNFRKKSK